MDLHFLLSTSVFILSPSMMSLRMFSQEQLPNTSLILAHAVSSVMVDILIFVCIAFWDHVFISMVTTMVIN